MTCYCKVAALLATLGFVAVLVGMVTPGWVLVEINLSNLDNSQLGGSEMSYLLNNKITLAGSIFYVQECVGDVACASIANARLLELFSKIPKMFKMEGYNYNNMSKNYEETSAWLIEVQIEGGAALLLGFIGMICCYIPLVNSSSKNNKGPAIASVILLIISGIVTFVLVGRAAQLNSVISTAETQMGSVGLMSSFFHVNFPYSLVLAGAGATCLLMAAIVAIIATCMMRNDQGGQVLSAVQVGGSVHLANIVPGIQHTNQGYAVLQEPNLTIQA